MAASDYVPTHPNLLLASEGVSTDAVRGVPSSPSAFGVISRLRAPYLARQMTSECRPRNEASWALFYKVGFRLAGRRNSVNFGQKVCHIKALQTRKSQDVES